MSQTLRFKYDHPYFMNIPRSHFPQWNLNYDVIFVNLSIDSKFGYLNFILGLCIVPSFSGLVKETENWDFKIFAKAAIPNFC